MNLFILMILKEYMAPSPFCPITVTQTITNKLVYKFSLINFLKCQNLSVKILITDSNMFNLYFNYKLNFIQLSYDIIS